MFNMEKGFTFDEIKAFSNMILMTTDDKMNGYRYVGWYLSNVMELMDEYFNGEYGMGYMHNCILNQRLREQSHSLLKYFDPETYMEKLRARWIQRQQSDDYGANVQYDELLNSEAYQKKRQSFIEKIFCKNPRGSII